MMHVDKIDPYDDSRVCHRSTLVNGRTYKYIEAIPQDGKIRGNVILVHGFPDISMAWRYQIPALLALHLHVVCPDMMGYGGTDAPAVPPESISLYGQKRAADDIKELARKLGFSKFILGGHDWGGAVVYRAAQYHPENITHVFTVCTPFSPTTKNFISLENVVERAPQFGYQLQFAGREVEFRVSSPALVRKFLHGAYGARADDQRVMLSPENGVDFTTFETLRKTKLLSEKEMDYYVEQFSRNGLHGPLNWYRTREVNWLDEQEITTNTINIPVLFIQANRDAILRPSLSAKMEKFIPLLTRHEVDAAHWALWERPGEVNKCLSDWFEKVVFGTKSRI